MKWGMVALLCIVCTTDFAQSATEVVKIADEKMRGKTSLGELTIITTRPTWSREMDVKTWIKGSAYSMILIQSPPRDKGIVFLKRKKEVWNWMPILERTIKLPPSMMANSWMGTDFTNDDLVKESSAVEDYVHSFSGDTVVDNRPCYIIQFIPKPATAIVWSKLMVCIDKKDHLELYTQFFDDDGKLVNTMSAYDIRIMDGRLIPTRMEMVPADKKNHKTTIVYKSILFNRNINDDFFTIEKMKQFN